MGLTMMAHAAIRASFFMAGNTLAYADVKGNEIGHASVLFTVAQQLSLGFGINIGAMLIEAGGRGAADLQGYRFAYLALALLPLVSLLFVRPLRRDVGDDMRRGVTG
jgi:hypothetical protein